MKCQPDGLIVVNTQYTYLFPGVGGLITIVLVVFAILKAKMSEHKKAKAANGIVTSDAARAGAGKRLRLPTISLRWWLLSAVFLVLIVAGFVTIRIWSNHRDTVRNERAVAAATPDDYTVLTEKEADAKLKYQSGYSVKDLQNKNFTREDFKSFNQAYAVARALYAQVSAKKALTVYAIAAQMAPKTVDYSFYVEYAQSAQAAGDSTAWKAQLENAKAAITSSGASETTKQDRLNTINSYLGVPSPGES